MKLIIDIPEEIYKNIKDGMWCGNNITSNAIENGIPIPDNATACDIDAIKAEIEELQDEWFKETEGWWCYEKALRIIDKYTKGEKE